MPWEDRRRVLVARMVLFVSASAAAAALDGTGQGRVDEARTRATPIVADIRQADYRGERDRLRQLAADLERIRPGHEALATLIHYWRGFAYWRSAINGFNDGESREALDQDLASAAAAFEAARAADPAFVDATVGLISATGYQMYLHRDDRARVAELVARVQPLVAAARAAAPDHPRLLWALGPSRWASPRGPGETAATRQAGVIADYERALQALRRQAAPADPLVPSWGEPELLMSLAWSHLTKEAPDARTASGLAAEALKLVPDWHYVRDILMPQIKAALPQ